MAEGINALILPIGADATQFQNSINDVKNKIKELSATIKATPFNLVQQGQKDELAGLISTLDKLNSSVSQTSSTLAQSQGTTKGARTALTSLSLVAQDLPFGFIAIQNNLPAVISSFGELTKGSGGLKRGLSEISSALLGPAGLFLAFSIVTSGITKAVQKYGSLGNAIDAFIGKTVTATQINEKFAASLDDSTKASTGEIANLNSLVRILTSANSTRDQQVGAFEEINKRYPAILTNQKIENIRTAESIALIAKRTKLYQDQILLEGRREALIKLVGESALDAEKALKQLTSKPDFFSLDELALQFRSFLKGGAGVNSVIARTKVLSEDFNNANISSQAFAEKLNLVNENLTNVNGQIETITQNFKDQEKAAKAAEKALSKTGKSKKNRNIGKVTEGELLDNGIIIEDLALLSKITEANVRITNASVDKMRRYRDKNLRDITGIMPLDLLPKKLDKKAGVPMSDELRQQVGTTLIELDTLSNKFIQTNDVLQSAFFQPLTSAFEEFFETGKIGFKEFGKSVIKTIQQIVAKILATGIINLLASILVPGGAQAASLVGGAAGAGGGIGRAFGDAFRSVLGLGGNRVAAPSFGGIGGGGMQMSGQVVFVQRGSDLVGVLNRTNGTINRVG